MTSTAALPLPRFLAAACAALVLAAACDSHTALKPPDGGGSGGAVATGGAGGAGKGGAGGSAGSGGAGGASPGAGGVSGAGGSNTGGSPGTGGAPATGGSLGADGGPATGGASGAGGASPGTDAAAGSGGAGGGTPLPDASQPGGDAPPATTSCETSRLGPAPLLRLTSAEYGRTVRDLLGITTIATALPPEPSRQGFVNRAEVQAVTPLLVQAWADAADELARSLAPRLGDVVGCPVAAPDAACVRGFITKFGARVFRRPLTPVQVATYEQLYKNAVAVVSAGDALGALVRAFLQSPNFLYRPELATVSAGPDRLALDGYHVATRLSYLVWGSMPDDVLLDAAAAGKLGTPAEIEAQARRMLADARAREGVVEFFRQWFDLDAVASAEKDPQVFPSWSPVVARALAEQARRFVHGVVFEGDGRLGTLFASSATLITPDLAPLYGVSLGGTGWQQVLLNPSQRGGILTLGWFAASRASALSSAPTQRGTFVRDRLLCMAVPPPPPNVPIAPPPPDPTLTTRERYQRALTEPACAACHHLLDPIGFAFESYDAIGQYRTTENGKPIDASGILEQTDVDGPFKNAVDLSLKLGNSTTVANCAVQRWFEHAHGRDRVEEDSCRLQAMQKALAAASGNLRELVVAIVRSDDFRTRPAAGIRNGVVPLVLPDVPTKMVWKMIIDVVLGELRDLSLPTTDALDRMHLDGHLEGLRELEKKLAGP
jgi:hypothetical protein